MKIEKWKYGDKEVEVPILDEDEIETNETIEMILTEEEKEKFKMESNDEL